MYKRERSISYNMILFCVVACCMIGMGLVYWNYIEVAKSTVPIMDYWHWIRVYGEKIQNGTITFADFFFSEKGQHIQPLPVAIQFLILKYAYFDVQPLVIWGAVVRLLVAFMVMAAFLWHHRKSIFTNRLLTCLSCILLIGSVLNYNQWEMTTEPFSFGCSLRVLLYYLSFAWAAIFIAGFSKRTMRGNLLQGTLLGCMCAFMTVFFSGAYFVGYLPAIGLAFVGVYLNNRKKGKEYLLPMLMWFVISLAGAIFYYWLYTMGGRVESGVSIKPVGFFLQLLDALTLFWGAALLPEKVSNLVGMGPFYICGTILLLYIIMLVVRYFKSDISERNLFPLICVLYSMIISVVIACGRVEAFGESTMVSSRYVVESSIGLVGIVWLSYVRYAEADSGKWKQVKGILISLALMVMLGTSTVSELHIAPYRGLYSEGIKEIMLNIDAYSDEEMAVTQGNADDVRYCVKFFKENDLSIFREQ